MLYETTIKRVRNSEIERAVMAGVISSKISIAFARDLDFVRNSEYPLKRVVRKARVDCHSQKNVFFCIYLSIYLYIFLSRNTNAANQ